MARSLFGFPIRSDAGTFSGGSWEASLPLANMQTEFITERARSTDATTGSTTFDVDLGAAYPIRAIGLVGHNLSLSATVRVYGDSASDFATPDYDPGAEDVYPTIYPAGSTLWGADVASSPLGSEEWDLGVRLDFLHFPTSAQSLRYWRFAITDTGNVDGYVEIGRCVVAQGYQPTVSRARQGASLGYRPRAARTEMAGGAVVHHRELEPREFAFELPKVESDEALVQLLEFRRRLSSTEQILFSFDPDDTVHLHRRSFLAYPELDPLGLGSAFFYDQPITLVEVIQ